MALNYVLKALVIANLLALTAQASEQACRNPLPERPFCSAGAKAKTPQKFTLKLLTECHEKAANCVKNVLGDSPVQSIQAGEDVALFVSQQEANQWLKGPREWNPREAKIVALTALYKGLASLNKNAETLDKNRVLAISNPAAYNALAQEAWEDLQHELEACEQVDAAFGGSKIPSTATYNKTLGTRQSEAVACAVKLNFDGLTQYKLLKTWPGCACPGSDGKAGRYYKSGDRFVCLSGLTPQNPIEERMPQAMAAFMHNLGEWADKNGMRVKEVHAGGCGIERFVSNGLARRIQEAEEQGKKGSVKIDMQLVSGHAESRACDLKWVKFESKDCKSGHCPEMKLGLSRDEECAYSRALLEYSQTSAIGLPLKEEGPRRTDASCGKSTADWSKMPRGLVKYRELQDEITANRRPAKMSEEHWMQLKLGVAVRNAAVDGGLMVMDGAVDNNHLDHFHLSLPPTAEEYKALQMPLSKDTQPNEDLQFISGGNINVTTRYLQEQIRETIIACRLKEEITAPQYQCDTTVKNKNKMSIKEAIRLLKK